MSSDNGQRQYAASPCLLLRTTGPSACGETLTGGLSCAVLELTPAVIARARQRATQILAAWEQDRNLYEMYFWDSAPHFYDDDLLANCEEYIEQPWMLQFQEAGYARLPPEIVNRLAGGEFEPQRTECDQMAVCCSPCPGRPPDVSIKWLAIPKHGGIHVDTEHFPLRELESSATAPIA